MPTLSQSNMTPWGYQPTAKLSVHTKHTTHYTVAMAFIQSHGHFAAITKDGLLALCDAVGPYKLTIEEFDAGLDVPGAVASADRVFQEPHLFEVDADGMVSSREVRNWLGY